MAERVGPEVTLNVSCFGCRHHETVRYRAHGDSGLDHYCTESGERRDTGFIGWQTPHWCPFYPTTNPGGSHGKD